MNISVFLPNWVGDLVMVTPALRALRNHFGENATITGVLRPNLECLLDDTGLIDESIWFDPHEGDRALGSWSVMRQLRRRKPEVVVLFTHSFRAAAIARASGARRRVGFARNGRGWLLTDRLHFTRQRGERLPTPTLDSYLDLVRVLGCDTVSRRIELAVTPAEQAMGDALWRALKLPAGDRVVAFNCSGAFGPAKLWPAEYCAALARRIVDRLNHSVLVLCGPNERLISRQIVDLADRAEVQSVAEHNPSIGLSKACVQRSALLISTDSGPRHFAAAFGTPVVTLFGPTHIAWSETHYDRALHLQRKVDCGPCQQRECPLKHHRCMWELGVDEVYAAVASQLKCWARRTAA